MTSPRITKEVIEYLERLFPDELPDEPVSPADLGVLIGRQQVIRRLRTEYKRQRANELTGGIT